MRLSEACLVVLLSRSFTEAPVPQIWMLWDGEALPPQPRPLCKGREQSWAGSVSWALCGWLGDCRQPWADGSSLGQCGWGRQVSTCMSTRLSSLPEQTGPSQGNGGLPEPQLCCPNSHPCLAYRLVHLSPQRHLYIPPTCLHIHTGVRTHETPLPPSVHRCAHKALSHSAQTLTPGLSSWNGLGQWFSGAFSGSSGRLKTLFLAGEAGPGHLFVLQSGGERGNRREAGVGWAVLFPSPIMGLYSQMASHLSPHSQAQGKEK